MKRIIIYFPLLDHFLPTYLISRLFISSRCNTIDHLSHRSRSSFKQSNRINPSLLRHYLCTKHALFQQLQKLCSSSIRVQTSTSLFKTNVQVFLTEEVDFPFRYIRLKKNRFQSFLLPSVNLTRAQYYFIKTYCLHTHVYYVYYVKA